MAYSTTETLIDYWQARFLGAGAPTRASIDPMDFPTLLPQVFILGRRAPGQYGFRLVGGLVAELHGRDLRGADFSGLWAQNARLPLQTELERTRRRPAPTRVSARAEAGVYSLDVDIALMPLANAAGEVDRFLGIYQPKQTVARLRGMPAERLQLVSFDGEAAGDQPRLRLAAVGGQRVG